MHELLRQTNHRPFPPPDSPWVMTQVWSELLFAHWSVTPRLLRPYVPAPLDIDTYEGRAWLGVVPFSMSGVRLRLLPPLPGTDEFLELNVRTYVTVDGAPGVYFFSLDASSVLAVEVARRWYHLPYYRSNMRISEEGGWYRYRSERTDRRGPSALFQVRYRPRGSPFIAGKGSIESFLTDRYCLFVVHNDIVYRGDIHHGPWPLHLAEAHIEENTLTETYGLSETEPQLLHFAHRIETLVWPVRRVSSIS